MPTDVPSPISYIPGVVTQPVLPGVGNYMVCGEHTFGKPGVDLWTWSGQGRVLTSHAGKLELVVSVVVVMTVFMVVFMGMVVVVCIQ